MGPDRFPNQEVRFRITEKDDTSENKKGNNLPDEFADGTIVETPSIRMLVKKDEEEGTQN